MLATQNIVIIVMHRTEVNIILYQSALSNVAAAIHVAIEYLKYGLNPYSFSKTAQKCKESQ